MNCTKCQSEMEKVTPIISGNSKYEQWKCEMCDHIEMRATSVLR